MTHPKSSQVAAPTSSTARRAGLGVRTGLRAGSKAVKPRRILSDGAISDSEYAAWSVD